MIFRQAWRVFRREGWKSLFAKAKKKAALYRLQNIPPEKTTFSTTGGTMDNPNDTVKNWLQDNRNNFGNPFYNLLNFLDAHGINNRRKIQEKNNCCHILSQI